MQQMWLLPKQAWSKMMLKKKKKHFQGRQISIEQTWGRFMSIFPWHWQKQISGIAARPSIRPLQAIKRFYFYILTQKNIFNKNSGSTSGSDEFTLSVCLKLIGHRREFKSLSSQTFWQHLFHSSRRVRRGRPAHSHTAGPAGRRSGCGTDEGCSEGPWETRRGFDPFHFSPI